MGNTVPMMCPIAGCGYSDVFTLGLNDENEPFVWAEREMNLRVEHPNHAQA